MFFGVCDCIVMVPSHHQCPGAEGTVFLLVKDYDPHRLCTSCRGKTCGLNGRCEECHDWSDNCLRVGEYMAKLSVQHENKYERKAKASSSPAMPVPQC